MADTNDTIDGLLAEFRGYAAGMPPSYHVTMSWHDFSRMLDRFDAAHRRERNRNCDRFASAEEAWDAYDEWVESYRAKGKVQPFNEFGWLYAEAKEGGAK
jgi:hypothetical protein